MILTLQTQLLPDPDQAALLKATMERFNEAANWLAGVAFEHQVSNKFVLQRLAYKELRARFKLPADMAIRCIAQVVEAFKRDKSKRPMFQLSVFRLWDIRKSKANGKRQMATMFRCNGMRGSWVGCPAWAVALLTFAF